MGRSKKPKTAPPALAASAATGTPCGSNEPDEQLQPDVEMRRLNVSAARRRRRKRRKKARKKDGQMGTEMSPAAHDNVPKTELSISTQPPYWYYPPLELTDPQKRTRGKCEGKVARFVRLASLGDEDSDGAHDEDDTDCYREVLYGRGRVCDGTVRASWLNGERWISSCQLSLGNRCGTAAKDVGRAGAMQACDSTEGLGNMEVATREFESLQRQLNEIKRRLWPASVDCAAAQNVQNVGSKGDKAALVRKLSPKEVFEEARRTCNPFEELGEGRKHGLNGLFVNRSAMKLANIDAILGFRLTPSTESIPDGSPFRFVDLCGAPGGFSEYILHRCFMGGISARGWGMSLIGSNDDGKGTEWKLEHLVQLDGGANVNYRVSGGADGSGDVYSWDNVEALREEIRMDSEHLCTDEDFGLGYLEFDRVDLVVSDGGFDAQRDSECQEALTHSFVVCQVAAGLRLLCRGGSFVLKMFGSVNEESKQVLQLLFESFEQITITKPVLSRPASAERYVVCFGYRNRNDWDAKNWRDAMLARDGRQVYNGAPGLAYSEKLSWYVSALDRDVLKLNIKACFAILSCIERKRLESQAGSMSCGPLIRKRHIDVHMYKKAWKIGG